MRLLELSLHNFMGIRSLSLEPLGEDLNIYGDNGAGKTTIASAWSWVLWGKDSAGDSQFAIKTLTPSGEAHHGLDHEVEAVLELESGRRVQLRKIYRETWTKRRGEAQRTLTGHTTDHFVDGVPLQKQEYDAEVAAIAEESAWRLLTDPLHFAERMHWEERRRLLLEVCGDVTDAEVIASDDALADLTEILGDRDLERHRQVLAARKAEINKELDRLPVRIDEVTRGLPDLPAETEKEIEHSVKTLRAQANEAEAERQRVESGGEAAEKRRRLAEVDAELQGLRTAAAEKAEGLLVVKRGARNKAQAAVADARAAAEWARKAERQNEEEIAALERRMAAERERFDRVNAEAFSHEEPDTCAACGQALPADRVQAARERALAAFNEDKARRLAAIREEGQRLKARRDELAAGEAPHLSAKTTEADLAVERAESELAAATVVLEEAEAAKPRAEDDERYAGLETLRTTLDFALETLRTDNAAALASAKERIDRLRGQVRAEESRLALFGQRQRGEARIEELKAREKELAAEFERLEHEDHLCEEFTRTKVRLLEGRINERFRLARFQLFKVQVNGGLRECCEVTVNGVPYSSGLNHGARVAVGLDIIRTLQEHFSLRPPVFIDQAESFTSLPEMDCQVIRLIVSEADKELRIERVNDQGKES